MWKCDCAQHSRSTLPVNDDYGNIMEMWKYKENCLENHSTLNVISFNRMINFKLETLSM